MLRGLAVAFVKDLRLLARDRAALVFLTIAPVIVITVAGLSLASLYGAGPKGTTAYRLPFVDEDRGEIGGAFREALEPVDVVKLEPTDHRERARSLVVDKRAGVALVIPAGATEAVARGEGIELVLFTDPVKYLEIASVRGLIHEIRHRIEAGAWTRAGKRVSVAREEIVRAENAVRSEVERLREVLADLDRERATARKKIEAEARAVAAAERARVRDRLEKALERIRAFLADLGARRVEFERWLANARENAGRYADRIPPPPPPLEIPREVEALISTPLERLVPENGFPAALSAVDVPGLPDLPAPPRVELPAFPSEALPGAIEIREESVTGAPERLNTFDQNVPGFSVTFLLLGMLFGVSLGLLDERDWGTLERVRTAPTPFAAILLAKLLSRFVVGVVQMLALFAVGWIAFGVSLGPEPPALLLPILGIAFAGTALGLVVAGVARSRDSVLPVGSIVIVTMAAAGGCWWPIDLEPEWMRSAALAFPTTWAMAAFNDLMIRRQPVSAALQPTAVLLAYGAVYLVAGLALFRRHL